MKRFLFLVVISIGVSGCASNQRSNTGLNAKSAGHYKVGSPYKIKGKKYYPKVDYSYNKKGIASWYGPGFHGKRTANGEVYDQNALTAAHKTLPLPSIVKVTNLENRRSIVVRINDRGPFAPGRIIDMSKRGAELLGFKNKGITKVRVKILEEESKYAAALAKQRKSTKGLELRYNKGYKGSKQSKIDSTLKQSIKPAIIQETAYKTQSSTVDTSKVFVQAAAFSSHEPALKLASSLNNYGGARIYRADTPGQTFYRVRFPLETRIQAETLHKKLVADGYQNSIIVVE